MEKSKNPRSDRKRPCKMSFRDFCRAFPFSNEKMSPRIILYESAGIRYMADGTRMKKGDFFSSLTHVSARIH